MIINKYVKTYSLVINWFRFICELNFRHCKDDFGYSKKFDAFHYVGITDDMKCVYSDEEIYSPMISKFLQEY